MERLAPIVVPLAFIAFLSGWWWFLYQRSGSRAWNPVSMAFSTTAMAALFMIAGSIGFFLDKRERFFAGSAWSGSVIWWQVAVGVALMPLALFFWWRGFRDIDRRLGGLR